MTTNSRLYTYKGKILSSNGHIVFDNNCCCTGCKCPTTCDCQSVLDADFTITFHQAGFDCYSGTYGLKNPSPSYPCYFVLDGPSVDVAGCTIVGGLPAPCTWAAGILCGSIGCGSNGDCCWYITVSGCAMVPPDSPFDPGTPVGFKYISKPFSCGKKCPDHGSYDLIMQSDSWDFGPVTVTF